MMCMDSLGKSKTISERLRQEILSGKFDMTGKLPSDRMLMRRFAVARATVQAAMRELKERNLIDRKPGYGTFLTEIASAVASRKFGVIMPDGCYPFYMRISEGIEQAAKKNGWTILSAALGSSGRHERAIRTVEFAEVCKRERVCGVFFQPLQLAKDSETVNKTILAIFEEANIPVVLLDSDIVPPPRRSRHDLVGMNNVAIGYELGRLVVKRGAKRVIYFSNPYAAPTSLLRGYGVSLAVTESGLPWKNDNVFFADPTDTTAAKRLFASKNRPDAIVAVNDYVASLLLKTLKAIGKVVPDDVLLAGVNGDSLSAESEPPITTAVQPCERIGEAAVQLMMQRIADPDLPPREVHFSAPLDERLSTRRRKRS